MTNLAWARDQLALHSFWPGHSITVEPASDRLEIVVRRTVPDSRNPGSMIGVEHRQPFTIDPFKDGAEDAFTAALLVALEALAVHEVHEGLRRAGKLVKDPHADSSRWQCCGVGPTKRPGVAWACPKCGKEHGDVPQVD